MQATFRPATMADLDTVLRFSRALYEHDHSAFDAPRMRQALVGLLDAPPWGRVYVIESDGAPVGYLVLTFGYSLEYRGRIALIDELFIAEAQRGQGLGRAALAFAESEGRALGITALHLEVDRANTHAQAVYHASGFFSHDRLLMAKWVGDE